MKKIFLLLLFFCLQSQAVDSGGSLGAGVGGGGPSALASGHWLFLSPGNDDFPVVQHNFDAKDIKTVVTKCESGTITVDVEINGTDVTGCTAIATTSTESVNTCSAAKTLVAGDTIEIVTISDSSCVMLSVDLEYE